MAITHRLPTVDHMTDEALERNVIDELASDPKIDSDGIAVSAKSGIVTLTAVAEWRYQREDAEFIAANVLGVIDGENDVDILSPIPDAGEVTIPSKKSWNAAPSSTPTTSR